MSDDAVNKPGWTLSDIAEKTGKTTSGVANWRTRDETFPKPIGRDGVALVFDPVEVQKWLEDNKHLIEVKPEMDTNAWREEQDLSKTFWNSLETIRGKVPSNQTFYFFTDALAHGFDLRVESNEHSAWTKFVSDHSSAASDLYENWIKFFSSGSAIKNSSFSTLLHILPELVGFGEPGLQHLTPKHLAQTIAKIVAVANGHLVVDPCVGVGTLLLETSLEAVGEPNLYGRELNTSTARTARAVFSRSGVKVLIEEGDSVRGNPLPVGDRVVAAPPISQRLQLSPSERKDIRWDYADPGTDGGDLVWAQLILGAMNDSGIGAMLTSQAILFRRGRDETFRRRLIRRGHLEAVITLPAGMLYGTGIPSSILVFNKAQKSEVLDEGVLFVDVSINKFQPKSRGRKNVPYQLPGAIAAVVLAHRNGVKLEVRTHPEFEIRYIKVRQGMLAENEFNLLPNRYIKPGTQGRKKDDIKGMIAQVEDRIAELNRQLAQRRNLGRNERNE